MHRLNAWGLRTLIGTGLLVPFLAGGRQTLTAAEIVGFTTAYRLVDVATAETGILDDVLVREGDLVQKGQPLARLDDQLNRSQVAIARHSTQLKGQLAAARAECRLRQSRSQKLEQLAERGSARPEEVERAKADLQIAEGRATEIEELLQQRALECRRAELLLQRRTISAPLAGVVSKIWKEPGEFVGPSDPQLLTVVQLDPLLANFPAPSSSARNLAIGQKVKVKMIDHDRIVEGTVDVISPVVDGKSGTMRIKVRIPNAEGELFSGEPCVLQDGGRLTQSVPDGPGKGRNDKSDAHP